MNLMEASGGVSGVVCSITSAINGFKLYGLIGLILGIPIGFIVGYLLGFALVVLGFFIAIQKEKIAQHWNLKGVFGKYWSKSKKEEWDLLSSEIECGEKVSGQVVSIFYYGVFINTNHGFPALLKCAYREDEELKVGDEVEGYIRDLDCSERFIELTQKEKSDVK